MPAAGAMTVTLTRRNSTIISVTAGGLAGQSTHHAFLRSTACREVIVEAAADVSFETGLGTFSCADGQTSADCTGTATTDHLWLGLVAGVDGFGEGRKVISSQPYPVSGRAMSMSLYDTTARDSGTGVAGLRLEACADL